MAKTPMTGTRWLAKLATTVELPGDPSVEPLGDKTVELAGETAVESTAGTTVEPLGETTVGSAEEATVDSKGDTTVEPTGGLTGTTGTGLLLHLSPVQHPMLQSNNVQFCGFALNHAVTASQAAALSVVMK